MSCDDGWVEFHRWTPASTLSAFEGPGDTGWPEWDARVRSAGVTWARFGFGRVEAAMASWDWFVMYPHSVARRRTVWYERFLDVGVNLWMVWFFVAVFLVVGVEDAWKALFG